MICKRCGTGGVTRVEGFCLHCQIAVDIEKELGCTLAEAGVDEGFPDWQKPTYKELAESNQGRLL